MKAAATPLLFACAKPQNQAPATPPTVQVGVVTVRSQSVPLYVAIRRLLGDQLDAPGRAATTATPVGHP